MAGTRFSGGIGTVFGTLVGALIVAVLNNGLTLMNVSFYWQLVVKGAVIILEGCSINYGFVDEPPSETMRSV